MRKGLPVAAIIGRPNVGKSSLFNALVKKRKSIVDETEGVTRDINIEKVETDRTVFWIYDTAGYLEKGDRFNKLVQQKVMEAIADADLILLMTDGREIHPIDNEIASFLRRQKRRVIVLANKLDNAQMELNAYNFYSLGFDEVIPMSVLQKSGLTTLTERIEDIFADFAFDQDSADEIHISLVGKPNVGKSLLLNTLLGFERSIVSDVAGTTRDSLDDVFEWEGSHIRLIDTAGIRRHNKIGGDIEYYSVVRSVQAIERSDVVIQLIDATEPLSRQDKHISEMVQDKGRAMIFAVNKWDLVERGQEADNYQLQKDYEKQFYKDLPEYAYVPMVFISAKDGYKIPRLMQKAIKVYNDFQYRTTTSDLNEWVKREVRESDLEHPSSNLKVYYCTQVHTAPPRFVFFINKKEHMRKDFPRFLENRLRLAFEFEGVPIHISFREKETKKN